MKTFCLRKLQVANPTYNCIWYHGLQRGHSHPPKYICRKLDEETASIQYNETKVKDYCQHFSPYKTDNNNENCRLID